MDFKLVKSGRKETISVNILDILPDIKFAIRKKYKLDDSVSLHLCSNIDFLLFGVVRNDDSICDCRKCKENEL